MKTSIKTQTIIPVLLFTALLAGAQPPGAAPDRKKILDNTRSHYTKYDYRIPMRDGIKLFTSVYVPKDRSQTYPFLMERTPYSIGPYGTDNYRAPLQSEAYEKEGFIFVYQDVRGRYLSEGTFIDVPPHKLSYQNPHDADDASDTYDTIEWLLKNVPANNGKAGIKGISYNGFYAAYAMINAHPALKAASPQAPMGDVGNGDDAYHNGAFYLAANFGFYTGFKPRGPDPERPQQRGAGFDFGTPDQYDFYLKMGPLANSDGKNYLKKENAYWSDLLEHPNYDDYWSSRALAPHVRGTTAAALWVGGWFDAEDLAGPLKLFRSVEGGGPKAANTLVMGPWNHGGWSRGDGNSLGNLDFGSKTGEYFREQIELPFFVFNLKGKGKAETFPKAWVFETGTNQWVKHEAWPPKGAVEKKLYFGANGSLSFEPERGASAYDEYTSDPAHPVPVLGFAGQGMPGDYMTVDQRFASSRPDVLVYETAPLENDVTIAGPVTPVLRVSTSGTDSDFVVKLIDVYPSDYPDPDPNPMHIRMGGYQQMLRGEPFRGKFRKSFAKPEPFTPGKAEAIEFAMPDVCHTFRPGHRIMVQVESSWFPLTDRNPQTFGDIPKAKAADFQKAVERVFRGGGESGSGVKVWVE
jgi:putative CocE/NonD family hydrolase